MIYEWYKILKRKVLRDVWLSILQLMKSGRKVFYLVLLQPAGSLKILTCEIYEICIILSAHKHHYHHYVFIL